MKNKFASGEAVGIEERMGDLWKAHVLLEGQEGARGTTKGTGCLCMTTEPRTQYARFYLNDECHHRHFKTATSLSKDVAKDLFHSVYIKSSTNNIPSMCPSLAITRLQRKLGTRERSIIATILHESPMELKHKGICLKSSCRPMAESGQRMESPVTYPLGVFQHLQSLCIQSIYLCFTFPTEKGHKSVSLLSL